MERDFGFKFTMHTKTLPETQPKPCWYDGGCCGDQLTTKPQWTCNIHFPATFRLRRRRGWCIGTTPDDMKSCSITNRIMRLKQWYLCTIAFNWRNRTFELIVCTIGCMLAPTNCTSVFVSSSNEHSNLIWGILVVTNWLLRQLFSWLILNPKSLGNGSSWWYLIFYLYFVAEGLSFFCFHGKKSMLLVLLTCFFFCCW